MPADHTHVAHHIRKGHLRNASMKLPFPLARTVQHNCACAIRGMYDVMTIAILIFLTAFMKSSLTTLSARIANIPGEWEGEEGRGKGRGRRVRGRRYYYKGRERENYSLHVL